MSLIKKLVICIVCLVCFACASPTAPSPSAAPAVDKNAKYCMVILKGVAYFSPFSANPKTVMTNDPIKVELNKEGTALIPDTNFVQKQEEFRARFMSKVTALNMFLASEFPDTLSVATVDSFGATTVEATSAYCAMTQEISMYWSAGVRDNIKGLTPTVAHFPETKEFEIWINSDGGSKVHFKLPWEYFEQIAYALVTDNKSELELLNDTLRTTTIQYIPEEINVRDLKNGQEVAYFAFSVGQPADRANLLPLIAKVLRLRQAYYGERVLVFRSIPWKAYGVIPASKSEFIDTSYLLFGAWLNVDITPYAEGLPTPQIEQGIEGIILAYPTADE